jgi:N-acetylglucosaminyldiphosphoundecaprenol N-acetyl-beta-D-mannosaminyltransferase
MTSAMETSGTSRVGKVLFQVSTLQQAASATIQLAVEGRGVPIRLANAYCVALASKDAAYADLLNSHGLTFADGKPVVWAMKWGSSHRGVGQVRGPSLFRMVLDHGRERDLSHFFLGSTDKTLSELVSNIQTDYPGIKIAGAYSPPFVPVVDEEFIERCTRIIRDSAPDIVWVGLGTPKQDFVASSLADRLDAPTVGVGAAFDFVAGSVPEAPRWVRTISFEWLYRLIREPRRLWRRYTLELARFVYTCVVERDQ